MPTPLGPSPVHAVIRWIRSASAASVRRPAKPCTAAVSAWSLSNISNVSERRMHKGEDRVLSFHSLKVTAVERAAEDAVSVTLAIPPALRERFHFDAGQYVTVRRMIDGREERRTYSIVTAPGSCALRLGVREQRGGRMSRELATRVRSGDVLDVGTPVGRFRTAVDPARTRSYVAFASGSGITPVLSLATDILG